MIGKKIKKLISDNDCSREEIAAYLKVSLPTLDRYYIRDDVGSDVLSKLSEKFNVPITYFFEENYKVQKIQKNSSTNDNPIIEELRATIEKVEKEKDRLYTLLENMSSNYSNLLAKIDTLGGLGKFDGLESSQQEGIIIVDWLQAA